MMPVKCSSKPWSYVNAAGMMYLPWFVTVSLAAASTGTCHMSVLIEMYNFEKNLSTLRSQLVQ